MDTLQKRLPPSRAQHFKMFIRVNLFVTKAVPQYETRFMLNTHFLLSLTVVEIMKPSCALCHLVTREPLPVLIRPPGIS
jgi:hypothetical protein